MSKGVYKHKPQQGFQKGHLPTSGAFKNGHKPLYNNGSKIGHKVYGTTRKKISQSLIRERCYAWRGGISFEPYTTDWTETLKRAIRERDNYICQLCSQYGNMVHHIDYDKENCSPDNLIILCNRCHSKTNTHRDYWINYFKKQ